MDILLPFDPTISLLGIHPRGTKARICATKTCTRIFKAAYVNSLKLKIPKGHLTVK